MLAPPPEDDKARDVGALCGEKRERYLKSLENKLQRLECPAKERITSKDILRSLSEARDDHLQQHNDPPSTIDSAMHRNQGSSRNDPWNVSVTFPPTNIDCSDSQQQQQQTDCLNFMDTQLEGVNKEKTCLSNLVCVCICCGCCCDRTRGRNWGGKLRYAGSNLSTEEGEYLMDCDELGLTWESNS